MKKCLNCGIEDVKHNWNKFCSRACANRYNSKRPDRKQWNLGLTKEDDRRLAHVAEISSIKNSGKHPRNEFIKGYKPWNKGLAMSNKTRVKISESKKEQWKDPEYVKKQMVARKVSPNKVENNFSILLNDKFPGQWKYVGDGQLVIGGKCPDFVHLFQNKIIEIYGNYWHRGQDPKDRIYIFDKLGYKTLIVWESDLKDEEKLNSTLINFVGDYQ